MIYFENGVCLVEHADELPDICGAADIFIDTETTSGDPKLKSLNPWHNCQPAGICISTCETGNKSWYIPVAHHDGYKLAAENIPYGAVIPWLQQILNMAKRWINHNVKYDAHVLQNCMVDIPEDLVLVDTITLAKLIDSDRGYGRGTYALDSLSKDWLHEDITRFEDRLQPYLEKNKDYGIIPIDILGEYGGQDVLTNKRLWKYIQAKLPEQSEGVRDVEIGVTRVLFDMERIGLTVNPNELLVGAYQISKKILELSSELKEIVGFTVCAWISGDCFDVICNTYGQPILGRTQTGNASFNADTLKLYLQLPGAPHDVINLILQIKKLKTLDDLFVTNWQSHHVNGVLHSSFNQSVRTARMSCKEPNAQQFNLEAKRYIHPRPGMSFIDVDFSQIEFRLIVHYINDLTAIAAYNEDPDTDFHQWVADMCGIPRKPAKNVNFCIGYGGGKKKVLSMLSSEMDLMESLRDQCDGGEAMFKHLCNLRAEQVFQKYHETLPNLRVISKRAERALLQKGFVFNGAGRHRHLPRDFAHKAFNSLCQSFAADIMKERLVALAQFLKTTPISLVCTVHDSFLMECPTDLVEFYRKPILKVVENTKYPLRVPLRADFTHSSVSWADCG